MCSEKCVSVEHNFIFTATAHWKFFLKTKHIVKVFEIYATEKLLELRKKNKKHAFLNWLKFDADREKLPFIHLKNLVPYDGRRTTCLRWFEMLLI